MDTGQVLAQLHSRCALQTGILFSRLVRVRWERVTRAVCEYITAVKDQISRRPASLKELEGKSSDEHRSRWAAQEKHAGREGVGKSSTGYEDRTAS